MENKKTRLDTQQAAQAFWEEKVDKQISAFGLSVFVNETFVDRRVEWKQHAVYYAHDGID